MFRCQKTLDVIWEMLTHTISHFITISVILITFQGLRETDRWKATVYRQFLLYSGPDSLVGKLNQSVYQNFLLLHSSIFILRGPTLCLEYSDYANDLLHFYVGHYADMYGLEPCVGARISPTLAPPCTCINHNPHCTHI